MGGGGPVVTPPLALGRRCSVHSAPSQNRHCALSDGSVCQPAPIGGGAADSVGLTPGAAGGGTGTGPVPLGFAPPGASLNSSDQLLPRQKRSRPLPSGSGYQPPLRLGGA